MSPLRLGQIPTGVGTADWFVTISDDDRPLLRVDVYGGWNLGFAAFKDAIVWRKHVFLGFGNGVYVIEPNLRSASKIDLGGTMRYFGAFYVGEDYLLAASAEALLRLAPDGSVLWKAPRLGLDGVVVHSIESGTIKGEGEWDPPGGWKPFVLQLDSGALVVD